MCKFSKLAQMTDAHNPCHASIRLVLPKGIAHWVFMVYSDSDSDSLFTKFYNKESVSKAVSIKHKQTTTLTSTSNPFALPKQHALYGFSGSEENLLKSQLYLWFTVTIHNLTCFFRFRFRFFIHQVLQQGKCLESGKYTNISKQHRHTSVACL